MGSETDRSRIAEYRAEQEARIRRYIAAQTAKDERVHGEHELRRRAEMGPERAS